MTTPPPATHHHRPGDGWVECSCGQRHWGLHGAAGLLLVRRGSDGGLDAVVLQHRAQWSDHGGTWGLPGGALGPDEDAVTGALREAHEEAGIDGTVLRVLGTRAEDHGEWSYTTVLAEAVTVVVPAATDAESIVVEWVPVGDATKLPLHPALAAAWPALLDEVSRSDR